MCSEKFDVIDRTTANSSACWATCVNSSLIGKPLWPCWLNFQGQARVLPLLLNCVGSIFILNGWPCSAMSRGLGSNVSTCDGPPSMNRKITRLARAAKCGGRTASGLRDALSTSAASVLLVSPAHPWAKAASATAPKPAPLRASISRREIGTLWRPQGNMAKLPLTSCRLIERTKTLSNSTSRAPGRPKPARHSARSSGPPCPAPRPRLPQKSIASRQFFHLPAAGRSSPHTVGRSAPRASGRSSAPAGPRPATACRRQNGSLEQNQACLGRHVAETFRRPHGAGRQRQIEGQHHGGQKVAPHRQA